jgi:hypothetical protein
VIIFAFAFAVRIPMVDPYYAYSFAADSMRCVEEARSFYFFLRDPRRENYPTPLSSYPNYSDGDYICSALLAIGIKPLCRAGLITPHLRDSDNSLIIFSMRWAGVLYGAFTAVFVFLILSLVSRRSFIPFMVTVCYYAIGYQSLSVDLIRIDHYNLFAASFSMFCALLILSYPGRPGYYILAGVSAGLVTATKVNFPFFLLTLFIVVAYLLWRKLMPWRYLLIMSASFILTAILMYHRWLMYPELIMPTLEATFQSGEVWYKYWGSAHGLYFLWGMFFPYGSSFITAFYLIVLYVFYFGLFGYAISRRNVVWLLCLVFLIQQVLLLFSPGVTRYGLLNPIWLSLLLTAALVVMEVLFSTARSYYVTACMLLLPLGWQQADSYMRLSEEAGHRNLSIVSTRIKAAEWVSRHIPAGSNIGVQFPMVSYPPIFEMPYHFSSRLLQYPFLDSEQLCSFLPPSTEEIRHRYNDIILSSKENSEHLSAIQQYGCVKTYAAWRDFYDSLPARFPCTTFSSEYPNYGLRAVRIIHISDSVLPMYRRDAIRLIPVGSPGGVIQWACDHHPWRRPYSFEVQIAYDSSFDWLVYDRSGYFSKYMDATDPTLTHRESPVYIPADVGKAMQAGSFEYQRNQIDYTRHPEVLDNLLAAVLVDMQEQGLTFGEALLQKISAQEASPLIDNFNRIYQDTTSIAHATLRRYLALTRLPIDTSTLCYSYVTRSEWRYTIPQAVPRGHLYYWRVRYKLRERVRSEWSSIVPVRL